MKQKIIIVGCLGMDSKTFAQHRFKDVVIEVVNNIEAKNIINSQFEREPIVFHNCKEEYFEPKIKEIPRNKFFDKPKNNFKKR